MPSSPCTAGQVGEARMIFQLAMALDADDDSDDDSVVDALTLAAVEPLQRKFMQDVGSEKLSIARLQREAAAHGRNHDDMSITVYTTFGFRLEWLPAVVAVMDVPDEVTLDGDHVCSGEEAVLLLLYRLRSTGPLRSMTKYTGRNISALSEIFWYMVRR